MDLSPLAQTAQALAEPIKIAVEKLSAGVGKLCEPTHILRIERAKADAAYLKQASKQDLEELKVAYEHRETYRKARREVDLRLIADKVNQKLFEDPGPNPTPPEDDWVEEFSTHAQDATSEPLRELWSRLYAGEVKQPGLIPRRMLRLVRDFDQAAASMFKTLCSCSINGRVRLFLAFEKWEECSGLSLFELKELQELKVIDIPTLGPGAKFAEGTLRYFNRVLQFGSPATDAKDVPIVTFTKFGEALFNVSDATPNEFYFSELVHKLKDHGWNHTIGYIKNATNRQTPTGGGTQ